MEFLMSMSLRTILGTALAASLALGLGACQTRSNPKPDTAGQYIDDATVTTNVIAAIANDVGTWVSDSINVSTERGVVRLSGFADSQDDINRAIAAAQKVKGVRSVQEDIVLRLRPRIRPEKSR
jgi:hyperosmotically inducible protein